jgi:hypothetical protein
VQWLRQLQLNRDALLSTPEPLFESPQSFYSLNLGAKHRANERDKKPNTVRVVHVDGAVDVVLDDRKRRQKYMG